MTPEQLDEIEKLADAATPGPYQVASVYPAYGVFRVEVDEPSECIAMCAVSVNEDADEPHVERQEAHARNGANARAIAVLLKHALPLVKALREAWEERDEALGDARLADCQLDEIVELVGSGGDGSAFGSVESLLCDLKERTEERDEARAEVTRLREAITNALTNGHMNALCWATNDDECVGRCRVLREALKEHP